MFENMRPKSPDVLGRRGTDPPARCCECGIIKDTVFSGLNRSQLDRLDQAMRSALYPKGAVIFFEGDMPRGIYCLCSGRVKLLRSSEDGKATIVRIADPGDILGAVPILANKPHDVTAEALEPCLLKHMAKDDFLRFLKENNAISLRLAEKLSCELYRAYARVVDMGCKVAAMTRLARLLHELSNTHGEKSARGIRIKVLLSQEEIAQLIGTSRETASRLLAELARSGIIAIKSRSILILNRTDLEAYCSQRIAAGAASL